MSIQDLLNISLVGSGLSLVIQYMKTRWGTESFETKLATIVVSLLVGTVYYMLRDTAFFVTIAGILMAASTFYAFFLK